MPFRKDYMTGSYLIDLIINRELGLNDNKPKIFLLSKI